LSFCRGHGGQGDHLDAVPTSIVKSRFDGQGATHE
jgi:hypothetical protein